MKNIFICSGLVRKVPYFPYLKSSIYCQQMNNLVPPLFLSNRLSRFLALDSSALFPHNFHIKNHLHTFSYPILHPQNSHILFSSHIPLKILDDKELSLILLLSKTRKVVNRIPHMKCEKKILLSKTENQTTYKKQTHSNKTKQLYKTLYSS